MPVEQFFMPFSMPDEITTILNEARAPEVIAISQPIS
jgi:hypothetical protein